MSASRSRLVFLLSFVGILLIQSVWILVVPPFRASDEYDHAFRAASVANGNWRPDYVQAPNGRGDLIEVPRHIVDAAQPVCDWLPYTESGDCVAVQETGDGNVLVASAAARYNPVFYWVTGSTARPFDGNTALYVMRATSALMCALVIALAMWVTSRWARSVWPFVAVLSALTPVVTHSTAVAAPNGLELASALLVWSGLLGLTRAGQSARSVSLLLASAAGGAVILTTVRTMGPMWLALIVLSVLLLAGWNRLKALAVTHRRQLLIYAAIVAVVTAASVAWTVTADTNSPGHEGDQIVGSPWPKLPRAVILWILQSIAAFPIRDEVAPTPVYAIGLAMFGLLLVMGWRRADTSQRRCLVAALLVSLAVPVTLTVLSYHQLDMAWQGRYGLPYSMGVLLLAGCALDSSPGPLTRLHPAPVLAVTCLLAAIACAVGQTGAIATVRLDEYIALTGWTPPGNGLVALVTVAGFLVLALSVFSARPGHTILVSTDQPDQIVRSGHPTPVSPRRALRDS